MQGTVQGPNGFLVTSTASYQKKKAVSPRNTSMGFMTNGHEQNHTKFLLVAEKGKEEQFLLEQQE